MVGVYEHLQVLILAKIKARITVNGLRLASLQVLHYHVERLFIALHELWL